MATIRAADAIANQSSVGGGWCRTATAAAWTAITKITSASTASSRVVWCQLSAYGRPIMFRRRNSTGTRRAWARYPTWAVMRLR